jgi:putative tryptophan/tyrosine transport system substrate-binding protein
MDFSGDRFGLRRREFILLARGAAATPLLSVAIAGAQTTVRRPCVGYLTPLPLPFDNDFRRGLGDLGYTEGQNVSIEARYGGGKDENLPRLAKELADIPVDVIVAINSAATAAAMRATTTIPIVMVTVGDPVGSKFVASLARSGNNVTGLSSLAPEISLKQLELLKEAVPNASRVAIFWNPLNPFHLVLFQRLQSESSALGIELQPVEVRTPEDLDGALNAAATLKPHSLLFLLDQVTIGRKSDVVKFSNAIGLPAMYSLRDFCLSGGLMSFGFDFPDLFYRAATYVDKILKGVRPSDLPIQQPVKFHFVINLITAKSLGLTLPTSIYLRADEVIE